MSDYQRLTKAFIILDSDRVYDIGRITASVLGSKGDVYRVNHVKRFCTCRDSTHNHAVCQHLLATLIKLNKIKTHKYTGKCY